MIKVGKRDNHMIYQNEMTKLKKLQAGGLFSNHFYSKRVNESSFENYETFKKIPFMYKQEIRNSNVFERTNTDLKDIYGIFSSSGTTGKKTFYVYNKMDKIVHRDCSKTYLSMLGLNENDLAGIIAPVTSGVMGHAMIWQFTAINAGYVNCEFQSPDAIINFVSNIPITIIATLPNVASNVAYSTEWTKSARQSKVNKLLMGGDFLSNERRKLLENVWDATCYNLYGMSEMFGPIAAECKIRDGMHYRNDYLLIEVIDPVTFQAKQEGEMGIAVYTSLWDKGFPLLRYWSDDFISINMEICNCGSKMPRMYFYGRIADHIYNNGIYIFPEHMENILFENNFIRDYKVMVSNEKIEILIESSETNNASIVVERLTELFSKKVEISFLPLRTLNYSGFGNRFEIIRD